MTEFVLWSLACLISNLGLIFFYYKLSETENKFGFVNVLCVIYGVLILALIKYFKLTFLSPFSFFLSFPIIFYSIEHSDLKRFVFNTVIIWIYGVLLDLFSMLVLGGIYQLLKFNIYNQVSIIVPSIFVFVLFIMLAHSKRLKKATDNLYNLIKKIKYADLMFLIFTIFIFVIGVIFIINIKHISINLMAYLIVILIIIVFILLLRKKYYDIENIIYLKTLRGNNIFYKKSEEEQRILKHNLIAKLLGIKSVSNKKAQILIDDLVNDFNCNANLSKSISEIPYGLDGVICEIINPYFNEINFKFSNQIKNDIFDLLKPRRYNVLVEKLTILLNNSIESCINSSSKILVINLYEEENEIIVEIKNSFSSNLDIESLGMINYSTKGKTRGLGLYSAFRNNEVRLNISVVNDLFVAKLCAKRNKQ